MRGDRRRAQRARRRHRPGHHRPGEALREHGPGRRRDARRLRAGQGRARLDPHRWPRPRRRCSTSSAGTCPSRARRRCAATRSPPTAASSPVTCPSSTSYLHYRMVDVSSVKELARRWYPRAYYASPEKRGGHRALADIRESVEELRYYREAIFVPQPGPYDATKRRPSRPESAAKSRRHETTPPQERFVRLDSSSPVGGRRRWTHGGCSSVGRAPGCDPGCRGFKSRHSPHFDRPLAAVR